MAVSVFDLFKIGIGPSSSHTVGPMHAARMFVTDLNSSDKLDSCESLKVELYGSLAATGAGHGSPKAILMGLEGECPATVDVDSIPERIALARENSVLCLLGKKSITFDFRNDLKMHREESLPFHPNGMRFSAYSSKGETLQSTTYFSVGGGFVINESATAEDVLVENSDKVQHPFDSADQLLELCNETGLSVSGLMLQNEVTWRSKQEVHQQLNEIWQVMQNSIEKGCHSEGIMPGGLKVKRRAAQMHRRLTNQIGSSSADPLSVLDWVTVFALAVNEENAMGGRIVTAPTNGAAGIIPAVLRYYMDFCPGAKQDDASRFLLTAGAIGILYKLNASISGAEVGCQGEVGSACSMAAGALTEVLGGSPGQVENAAEIAMEHNLGLTCDPIGGLVQVPCIERNAMAAIKAISAARMALRGDGDHFVSLDQVIKTMRDTGKDMQEKYKETARGGLAINVLEVPVSVVDC
ncbi:MAG: L-serine ammonia-lyase [Pseudohongiellaceae bacterium]